MERESSPHQDFSRVQHPLEGALVRLRAPEEDDADRLNEMFSDPEVLAGLLAAFPQSRAQFRDWAASVTGRVDEAHFIVETLEGEAIGGCALRRLNDRNRVANLGLWIGRPYWGQGYGTDAVRTLCRFGFRHMNLQRVILEVFETNARGRRAYENVGFRVEGTLRRQQFVGGTYVDELVMGLLADDLVEA